MTHIIAIATYDDNGHIELREFETYGAFIAWGIDEARISKRITALQVEGTATVIYSDDDVKLKANS